MPTEHDLSDRAQDIFNAASQATGEWQGVIQLVVETQPTSITMRIGGEVLGRFTSFLGFMEPDGRAILELSDKGLIGEDEQGVFHITEA